MSKGRGQRIFPYNEQTNQLKWKPPHRVDCGGLLYTACFQDISNGLRASNNCTHETLSKDTDDNGIGLALWRLTKGSGRWCNTHHTTGYMSDVVAQCLRYYESCASMLYIYIEEEGHETSPIVHFGRWTLSIRYILCCCLPYILKS